jgi:hypothetical protein
VDIWIDIVSMLEMLQDQGAPSNQSARALSDAKKAGYSTVREFRVVHSLSVEVPSVFGNADGSNEFGKVRSHQEWNSGDGRKGFVPSQSAKLQVWMTSHKGHINSACQGPKAGPAQLLAHRLADGSLNFFNQNCSWVSQFDTRLTLNAKTLEPVGSSASDRREYDQMLKETKEEAWNLSQQVLTDMFNDFSKLRSVVSSSAQAEEDSLKLAAKVLYATLRAHAFMDALLERQFERHPFMSPSLNNFSLAQKASLSDVRRLEHKIAAVDARVGAAQGQVDRRAAGGRGGAGGRGAGGRGAGGD